MSKFEDDGRFYAEGREVRRRPRARPTEHGQAITMGFIVCTMHEWLSEGAGEMVVAALNAALDRGEID